MLQINQLRCFVAVATELHFGRAAIALHMTQPPLTRQIQLLEHEVGVALLERNRRQVRLTPAGQAFLREAQDILRKVQSASLSARRAMDGAMGSVRAGFIPAASYSLLPALVQAARQALPGVDLSVTEMQTLDQVEALAAGRLDLGLVRPIYRRTDLVSECILREPFVLAAPVGHRLLRVRKLSVDALDGQPVIMYSPADGQYMHESLIGWFRSASVQPQYVQHIGHTHSMLALVDAGLGVALVPQSAERMRFSQVRYRAIAADTPVHAELHLCWRKAGDNPAAVALRQELLSRIAVRTESVPAAPSA